MADNPQDSPDRSLLLLVAHGDPLALDALQALARYAVPRVMVTSCDGVKAAIAQNQQVLVPVRMPYDHMQRALQAGEATEAALDAWCIEYTALLCECRKARRRIVILDLAMLMAQPAAVAKALGERLGVRFGTVPKAQPAPHSDFSAVPSIIAAMQLSGNTRALTLADELEAMCVGPVSARIPGEDVISAAEKSTALLAEERDLLRENLRLMLAETQRQIADKSDEAEKHLLRAQLDAVNRQLEEANDGRALHESELGAVTLQLAAARGEIAHIYASTSWKITGPMRAVKRGLTRACE